MRPSVRSSLLPLSVLALACPLAACSSQGGSGQPATMETAAATAPAPTTAAPAVSATATATSTASAAADAEGPPVCQRSNEKVWGAGANKLTGLTTKGFQGKVAVGFAFGNEPRVLVVSKSDGSTKLMKVKQGEKAKRPDPKEGTRFLMRVSPSDIGGEEARAFIDYRDEFKKDKRRHVWCGPADADDKFLEFDGVSWLDMDPKPEGEDKKKLFSWKKLGGYVELRDCRTFVSRSDKEVWALGSVLRGMEKPDGTNEWKMVFLVDFGRNDEEIVLHEAPLKGDPPKATAFEIPISRRIKGKGWLIASRFGGNLLLGLLDKDRKLQGKFKTYRGFATMPDIASTDEDNLVVTTGIGVGKERGLKALTISKQNPELPSDYTTIKLEPTGDHEGEASFSAPELTHDEKGRRWLVYTEGAREKGHLRITPLGVDLQPSGRTFAVTSGDVHASEARLIALNGGKLMVVYLRDREGRTELVSEQLDCEVKK